MSGLAGQIRYDGKPVEKDLLTRMGAILAHRGNDDAGVLIEGNTGLAHQYMALTGVTGAAGAAGVANVAGVAGAERQPMTSADGGQAILLDGTIINHRVWLPHIAKENV